MEGLEETPAFGMKFHKISEKDPNDSVISNKKL